MISLKIILEKVEAGIISVEEAYKIIPDLFNAPVSVGTTLTNDNDFWRGGYVYPTTCPQPNDYPFHNPVMYTTNSKTE